MIKNKSNLFLLVLITLLGLVLRFWQLDKFPVSLNWDEISHGYNAYSILTTGKDEWDISFPLIFRAFGDYKLPVYIYLTVIPVFLFGLNAFAVRFISALAGVLAIPLIYFLARQLFPDRKHIGLVAAALLAFSPWHFFISRPALEANLALTFILAGAYLLLRGRLNAKYYLLATIFLSLSLHTYNTARVFVPLLLLAFIFIYRKSLKFSFPLLVSASIFLVSLGLVVYQVFAGTGTARYQKLAILSESTIFQIGENRTNSRLTPVIARLTYNRPVYFITTYVKNYLAYFSPTFFNQSHGVQTQFAIPGQNLFTLPVLLMAVIGLYFLVRNPNTQNKFLLAFLLLSPLAAAATIDPPQALRPNPMIPAIILLAAYGLSSLPQKISPRLTAFVIAFSIALFINYLSVYFDSYQKDYSASWQYGYSRVASIINDNLDKYDSIIVSKRYGEPHIFYAFYSRLDPRLLIPGPENIRFEKSSWFWTDKIGKIYFVNDWQIGTGVVNILPLESGSTISTNNSLLITSPNHLPVNTTQLNRIDFLNGDPAFVIAKFN